MTQLALINAISALRTAEGLLRKYPATKEVSERCACFAAELESAVDWDKITLVRQLREIGEYSHDIDMVKRICARAANALEEKPL